jgi:hypothetical protein
MGINPQETRNIGIAMLPIKGSFAMKLLSKRQLKEVVLYSSQHIQRLENANRFPKATFALATGPVQEWDGLKVK